MAIQFSLARCKVGNPRKSLILNKDGALVTDDKHKQSLTSGSFEVLSFDTPAAFGAFLDKFPTNAAICAGIPKNGETAIAFGTVQQRDAGRVKIARCLEDLTHAKTYPLLIDYDTATASPDEVWQKFTSAVPEATGAAWVAIPSTTAFIYGPDGEQVIGSGKWHLYVICMGDASRFRDVLNDRAFKVFDTSPMHAAALHYEAAPKLPTGYTQRKPPAVVVDGAVFDLDSVELPPPPERPAIQPIPLNDDLERLKMEECMGALLSADMNPGTGTWDEWRNLINALTNLIGADAAADFGRAIAPKRPRNDADRIARTAPRQDSPMGSLVNIAKRHGYTASLEWRRKWHEAHPKQAPRPTAPAVSGDNPTPEPQPQETPAPSLRDLCIEIEAKGLTGSGLNQAIVEAAAIARCQVSVARTMYDAICEEADRVAARSDVAAGIDELQNALDYRLNVGDVLPRPIADLMEGWASSVNVKAEGLALGLLSGISCLHNPQSRFRVNSGFSVPPALWFALLAPTGEMKSPILHKVIGAPLAALDWQEKLIHDAKMEEWKQRRDTAKKNREEFTEAPPVRVKWIAHDSTHEQVLGQLASQSNGITLHYDELSSLRNTLERNNRQGDTLALYNGGTWSKMKVGSAPGDEDKYTDIASVLVSINGGLQLDVLKEHLHNGDNDGFWARFLFSYQPPSYTPLDIETEEDALYDDDHDPLVAILTDVYKHAKLLGMRPTFYRCNREAAEIYKAFNDEIEARRLTPGTPAPFAGILAKARGGVARVAMDIALIRDAFMRLEMSNPTITAPVMMAACNVMRYHIAQVQWIYAEAEAGSVEFLEHKLQKILQISGGKPIGASDCKRQASCFRAVDAGRIKEMFSELVAMDLGRMEGSGRTAKFVAVVKDSSNSAPKLPNSAQIQRGGNFGVNSETLTGSAIETPLYTNINQINQINHPYNSLIESNTKEPPLDPTPQEHPLGGAEFGNFGEFDPEPAQGMGSEIHHPAELVVTLPVTLENADEFTKRAFTKFAAATTPQRLNRAIQVYGVEPFELYLSTLTPEQREQVQQLQEGA